MAFTYIVPYAEEAGNISNTANITINNANVTNNANVGNTLTTSNLTASGNVSFTGANVSLGNVSNLHITGGTANYFLQTDGVGNLVWAAAGSSSNISNGTSNVSIATSNGNITMSVNGTSNVVVVSSTNANITGNINASNANLGNLVTANFYSGNGSLLTGINGANVSNVANANYANFAGTAFSVAGSNVSGQVANALVAGTVYTNAQPNITSVGTLTNLTISGNLTSTTANFIGNANVISQSIINASEKVLVSNTGATGTINFDITTQSVMYYAANSTANFTLNFRASSGNSLDNVLASNNSVTVAFLNTNGTTAYYPNVHQIDGSNVSVKWQGGNSPSGGSPTAIDAYSYCIIKTASNTYTILGAQVKFS